MSGDADVALLAMESVRLLMCFREYASGLGNRNGDRVEERLTERLSQILMSLIWYGTHY